MSGGHLVPWSGFLHHVLWASAILGGDGLWDSHKGHRLRCKLDHARSAYVCGESDRFSVKCKSNLECNMHRDLACVCSNANYGELENGRTMQNCRAQHGARWRRASGAFSLPPPGKVRQSRRVVPVCAGAKLPSGLFWVHEKSDCYQVCQTRYDLQFWRLPWSLSLDVSTDINRYFGQFWPILTKFVFRCFNRYQQIFWPCKDWHWILRRFELIRGIRQNQGMDLIQKMIVPVAERYSAQDVPALPFTDCITKTT